VRAIKAELPDAKTILGISNVSFGLPPAGREILNSVFLYHNTKAGLDAAIVNSEKLARYAEIPAEERALAEKLVFLELGDPAAGQAAVEEFTAHFRGKKASDAIASRTPRASLPLEERIARAVVEGSKEGLTDDLAAAMNDARWPEPLDIINGPLMAGMTEVGRLFNANELIVAEVLQSAEVMKAAVSFLEPHMKKVGADGVATSAATRGKVILATVKGDVHDIGKNLVDIILSNNGYQVINLGIKVPSERLIAAVEEHKPDLIGLSGLLVKSAQQMVVTAGDLKVAGVNVDLLVGGAALTRKFTHKRIAAEYGGVCTYAKDAMHGLALVDSLRGEGRVAAVAEIERVIANDRSGGETEQREATGQETARPVVTIRRDLEVPQPPDLDRHTMELDLDDVWRLLNPQMLYGKHLGVRGSVVRLKEQGDERLAKVERVVEEIKEFCRAGGMKARAVWQWFPAERIGNRIRLYEGGNGGGGVALARVLEGVEGLRAAGVGLAREGRVVGVTASG
jgi:5-methyltetrahydrofolate--homocysteine methyltransferase